MPDIENATLREHEAIERRLYRRERLTISVWFAVLIVPLAVAGAFGFWYGAIVAVIGVVIWFLSTPIGTCQSVGLFGVLLHLIQFLNLALWLVAVAIAVGIALLF